MRLRIRSSVSESSDANALGKSVGDYVMSALQFVSHCDSDASAWVTDENYGCSSSISLGGRWPKGVSNALMKGKSLLFGLFVAMPVVMLPKAVVESPFLEILKPQPATTLSLI